MTEQALRAAMARHQATPVAHLATTSAATLWRVSRDDVPCVLKVYSAGHFGNEASGLEAMQAWAGPAMVRILASDTDSLLMEALEGPLLGDASRAGQDSDACHQLAQTARILHEARPVIAGLPSLEPWFAGLFDLRFGPDCPAQARSDVEHARHLTRHLLDSSPPPVVLHGDLHHDNVIATRNGPVAFDAKGVVGDLAFEMANALRNPKGVPDTVRSADRFADRVRLFSDALAVCPQRLVQWATAKCALSIAWRCKGLLNNDPELDVLRMMVAQSA